MVPLFGKYLCYALLAVSLDLVWGYCGVLSLGHGASSLWRLRHGHVHDAPDRDTRVYGNPILPDFMVFLAWKDLPWYWFGFDHFWFAAAMVLLVPGLLAFLFGAARLPFAGHRRLSFHHHPGADLCADAGLLPQRHGVRRQQRPDGFQGPAPAAERTTKRATSSPTSSAITVAI